MAIDISRLIKIHDGTNNNAIIFNGQKITYSELNKIISNIAITIYNVLKDCNNKRVAIFLDRSPNLIAAIFATLSIKATYIPIDTSYPKDRIDFILNDSEALVIITEKKYKTLFNNKIIICTDEINDNKDESFTYERFNEENDIANIIYTSGTTGVPKGVMISFEALINFIEGVTSVIDFSKGKSIISFTTVSFDIFFLEAVLALNQGLILVLADNNEKNSPKQIIKLIKENNVKMLQITPSRLQQFINYDKELTFTKTLEELMIGGEMLSDNFLQIIKSNYVGKIYNLYGPTETTIWSTISDLTNKDNVDIGNPIKETELFILDENLKEVSIGEAGELCIAGEGLSKGYINREKLTNEKFIFHPVHNKILYRTGDLSKASQDGKIVILGRIDNQIKIRGFRIEPEEIENISRKFSGIKESIVVLNKITNQLVMYYTSEYDIDITELKEFLSTKLPIYMIPKVFIRNDKFNYTFNNKLDRKSIKNIDIKSYGNVKDSKENDSELFDLTITIINIIYEAIKYDIQIDKDSELEYIGINSVTYIKIVVDIEDEFDFEFDDDKLKYDTFVTVLDIVNYVKSKLK